MHHLLLGAQKAFLEAAAIADAQGAVGTLERIDDGLGIVERQRQRFFHQHRLAQFERLADRRGMLAFRRRDEHGVNVRMGDDLVVVGGVQMRAGQIRELLGVGRVLVGHRDEAHRRVFGREPCAQRADAARADDGDAELFCRHAFLPCHPSGFCLKLGHMAGEPGDHT